MRRVSGPGKLIFEPRLFNFERAQTLNLVWWSPLVFVYGVQRPDRGSPWVADMQVCEFCPQ